MRNNKVIVTNDEYNWSGFNFVLYTYQYTVSS